MTINKGYPLSRKGIRQVRRLRNGGVTPKELGREKVVFCRSQETEELIETAVQWIKVWSCA
jgi:hypothetical protein